MAGLVMGAIVIPLMQVSDALGRALLIGVLFGVGMAVYQLMRLGAVTGGTLGSIINSFDGSQGTVVSEIMFSGLIAVLYAILFGALIGVLITVPDKALKGGLVGMLFGIIIGAALYWLLGVIGILLDPVLFQLLAGLLVFGVVTAVIGGDS
ncbi:MAG: hypothetical protein M5U34_43360 [Chloroflexi bacterium]|nr:hypothetical protein [Chloroflexota bacterium]